MDFEVYVHRISDILKRWGFVEFSPEWDQKMADVKKWLACFQDSEVSLALRICERLKFYTDAEIRDICSDIAKKIRSLIGGEFEKTIFYPLGISSSASGSNFLYSLRKELKLDESHFPQKEMDCYLHCDCNLIFIDDIIGSGKQAVGFYKKYLKGTEAKCYYFSLLGFENGISKVRQETGFIQVMSGRILSAENRVFDSCSRVFTAEERESIKRICEKYGRKLYKDHPLGYDDTEALIVFPHNCPNNTLPLIWAGENNEGAAGEIHWHPLWERKKRIDDNLKLSLPGPDKDNLFEKVAEFCDKKFAGPLNAVIKYHKDMHEYQLKNLYLRLEKNYYANNNGSILLWLYQKMPVTFEGTFNGMIIPDLLNNEIKCYNLGIFMARKDLVIHFTTIGDLLYELGKVLATKL